MKKSSNKEAQHSPSNFMQEGGKSSENLNSNTSDEKRNNINQEDSENREFYYPDMDEEYRRQARFNDYGESRFSRGPQEYEGSNKRHTGPGPERDSYENYRRERYHPDRPQYYNDYYDPARDRRYYQEAYTRGDRRLDQDYNRTFRNTQGRFGEDYSSELYSRGYHPGDYRYETRDPRDHFSYRPDSYYDYDTRSNSYYNRPPYNEEESYRDEAMRRDRAYPDERRDGYRGNEYAHRAHYYRNYNRYDNPDRGHYNDWRYENNWNSGYHRNYNDPSPERGFQRPGAYGYNEPDSPHDERSRKHPGGNRGL